jgi:hypothetical protein
MIPEIRNAQQVVPQRVPGPGLEPGRGFPQGILSPLAWGRIGWLRSYIVVGRTRHAPRNSGIGATNSATVRGATSTVAPADRARDIARVGLVWCLAMFAVAAITGMFLAVAR